MSSVTDTVGGMVSVVVVFVATYLILKDYETLREMVHRSAFGEVVLALGKDLAGAGGAYLKAQGKDVYKRQAGYTGHRPQNGQGDRLR